MPQDNSKTFLKGAFILAAAALITKILSAVYRVPFQNIVGDTGFYIYQQVYPIYGIVIALSTYGFPVILSRFIAENQRDKNDRMPGILQAAFITLGAAGICLFLLLFLGSALLAGWMGDMKLNPLIKMISFSFLLLPFISVFRGYFQGCGKMAPTAVSQVLEQLIRVMTILILSYILVNKGYSLYTTGTGAIAGSITGGFSAFIVLLIFYMRHQKTFYKNSRIKADFSNYGKAAKELIFQGFAVSISGALLVLVQLVDSLNLYSLLVHSGIAADKAKNLKGIYDRGQPFIQLGTVAATSLSLALVPMIASEFQKGKSNAIGDKITASFKISIIVGLGASIGLMNLIRSANIMLFENDYGSSVLALFAVSILFSSIILTAAGILQGMKELYIPAVFIILGIIIKYFSNEYFVPKYGTMGAAASTVLSLGVIALLFFLKLHRLKAVNLPAAFYGKAAISAAGMSGALQLWLLFFRNIYLAGRGINAAAALGGVAIGGAVYIWFILKLRLLNDKDLELLPLGSKLSRIKK